jgi:sugar lactone lactonase YvrE
VSPDAMLETIGDRFGLTEGPVWVQDGASGHLLFSDLIANVIYKWKRDGDLSVFLENIYDGPDILNVGQQTRRGRMHVIIIGANGLTLDREGVLIFCCACASDATPIPMISVVVKKATGPVAFLLLTLAPLLKLSARSSLT